MSVKSRVHKSKKLWNYDRDVKLWQRCSLSVLAFQTWLERWAMVEQIFEILFASSPTWRLSCSQSVDVLSISFTFSLFRLIASLICDCWHPCAVVQVNGKEDDFDTLQFHYVGCNFPHLQRHHYFIWWFNKQEIQH